MALAAAVLGFSVLWTLLSHWKAWGLHSTWALDLALYHSAAWNLAEGNGFTNTLFPHRGDGLFAQDHFEPILVFASVGYRMVPRLETLFFIQALLMASGAVGVAGLLRQEGLRPWLAVAGGGVYLLWWPIWRLAMMDIRPVMWSTPFVLFVLVSLRRGCVRRTLFWGGLACLCREELPLILGSAAAAAWFWRDPDRKTRFGGRRPACLGGAALALTYLAGTWLLRENPTVHGIGADWLGSLFSSEEGGVGASALSALPTRIAWVARWALPVAIGAVCGLELLVVALPGALYLLVSPIEWTLWDDSRTHYVAVLLPGMVAASAVGWTRLLRWVGARGLTPFRRPSLFFFVLLIPQLVVLSWGWSTYIEPEVAEARSPSVEVLAIHEMIGRLPGDAAVLTSGSLVHLVAPRRHVLVIEEEDPRPSAPSPPLIPRAGLDPSWAILPKEAAFWRERVVAGGLAQLSRSDNFVLFGPASHPCPEAMVPLPPGTYQLGEADAGWRGRYPEGQVEVADWVVGEACVARDPFPGAPHPWFPDGLIRTDFDRLDRALEPTGRRLCSVAELLLASAGPDNWRYPYHPTEHSPEICDPNDPNPAPFGSHRDCVSPLGVRDLTVRSSWARRDGTSSDPGGLVVVGGLVREDTVYAATNFGVHSHKATDPRNFEDDGLRLCAAGGRTTAAQDEAWRLFIGRAVDAGSFEALIKALSEPETGSPQD